MTIFDSPRIYSLLEQYNPWWKNGQVSEKLPTMHREAYHDTLRTICSAELRRFAVLSGARRVGKTTVMKQLIVELLSRGVPPSNILYLTFDNPIFKLCGIDRVIQAYEEYVPHQGPYFFFLDEVQYAESWSLWVKTLYDMHQDLRLVATGSASPAIEKGASDSGVGRWRVFRMPTMTFNEYCHMQGVEACHGELPRLPEIAGMEAKDFNHLMLQFNNLAPYWNRYLQVGGFPELMQVQDTAEAQRVLREDVVDKVLKRDVPALFDVRNSLQLEKIFLYLCFHTGNLISFTSICSELDGVSKPTLMRYIDYLRDANLLYISHDYHTIGKRGLVARPKIYIADAALRNACLMIENPLLNPADLGIMVETTVYKHFACAFSSHAHVGYMRLSSNKEIDIVVSLPSGTNLLCEVKYRSHSPISSQDAILAQSADKNCIGAFVASKDLHDYGITLTDSGSRLIRIPAPALCYLLGAS